MAFNELEELLKIIVFQTDYKDEQIAKRIGLSRPHFNVKKNAGDETLIPMLKDEFQSEIEHFVRRYGAAMKVNLTPSDQKDQADLTQIREGQRELIDLVRRIEKKIDDKRVSAKGKIASDFVKKKIQDKGRSGDKDKQNRK